MKEAAPRVVVPFVLVTLIWSSTWLVVRGQLGVVPPAWSVAYRFGIAAAVLFAYAAATRRRLALSAPEHRLAIGYGLAQYCLNYLAVYLAERSVTSGLVAVTFGLLIVPNALLGRLLLGQPITRAFAGGAAVAIAGVALLFMHEVAVAPAGPRALQAGIGWTIAAVLAASVGNTVQARPTGRAVPVASFTAWGMGYGTLIDAALALAFNGAPVLPGDPRYWAGTLYLALLGSALAFTLYNFVIRQVGPARAAYSGVLVPVLAMLLSTLFEGYRWSWSAVAGCALGLAGLVVALRARAASPAR